MLSVLNFNRNKNELEMLRCQIRNLAAKHSDEKWNIHSALRLSELETILNEQPLLDFACYDVAGQGGLEYLHKIRQVYRDMILMLIAESSMSPMDYIKPDILASELVIRPYNAADIIPKLYNIISTYTNGEDRESSFILDTKEEKLRIPYCRIYYFEAMEKKVYIRLKTEEKGFYGTLDSLEKMLPECFLRCHRSFIVNWNYVERVFRSQQELVLSDGIRIPFSRTYKGKIMKMMQ